MTLSGNFAALDRMAAALGELARVPSRTAAAVSEKLSGAIQEQFDAGVDPDGEPWADLADATLDKGRHPPPLTDKRNMRDSVVVRPLAGAGVGITVDHPAGVHQTGWSGSSGTGPPRPVLPARGELPDRWAEIVETEAARVFRGTVRGAR